MRWIVRPARRSQNTVPAECQSASGQTLRFRCLQRLRWPMMGIRPASDGATGIRSVSRGTIVSGRVCIRAATASAHSRTLTSIALRHRGLRRCICQSHTTARTRRPCRCGRPLSVAIRSGNSCLLRWLCFRAQSECRVGGLCLRIWRG